MKLPFTVSQFLDVFSNYNTAIQPLQLVIYLVTIFVLVCFAMKIKTGGNLLLGLLALMWLINGIGYHILFFSKINPVAKVFGALFVIQAIILVISAFRLDKEPVTQISTKRKWAGWLIIAYGMVVYSFIGYFIGHQYPSSPIFGVAPCPTTIFTFGALLLLNNRVPRYVFIIPILWAVIGSIAAFKLGIREDIGLLVTAIIALIFILKK